MAEPKGILLESGTNEFEIIEFSVNNVSYGINVAKVREVINATPVTAVANTHPYVDGIFSLRGRVMPLINLEKCLSSEEAYNHHKIIVCEINSFFAGFKVHEVFRIHRISWVQMEPPPQLAGSGRVVGIVKMENRLIILLDFEKILSEINPEMNKKLTTIPKSTDDLVRIRQKKTVIIAEDSQLLKEILLSTLHTAGYNTIAAENGKVAWEKLVAMASSDKSIEEQVQLVITDIEMPQMDGHNLTKRIKEHDKLKELPVVIFSSLINPEMRRKGEALRAYAQITKPEIEQLIGIIDNKIAT